MRRLRSLACAALLLTACLAPSRFIRADVQSLTKRQEAAETEMKAIGCPGPDRCARLVHCGETVATAAASCVDGAKSDAQRCRQDWQHARDACDAAGVR